VRVLLISTYELGQQPLSVASATAALLEAGHEVRCVDVAVDTVDPRSVDWAERVAFSVPMHTAMRLASSVAESIRSRRQDLPFCFFGLYANVGTDPAGPAPHDAAIAGEYEPGLVAWVEGKDPGPRVQLGRVHTLVPDRALLRPLSSYTKFLLGDHEQLAGSVSASRGCSHRCRHCPVPVVYDGRVRAVDVAAVLADIDQLVDSGMGHVTFADPDFLNKPQHAVAVVDAMAERHPHLSFDCTVKVEHILRHRDVWKQWADAGCAFVVSAFESTNDTVLSLLDKGHTVAEASQAVVLLRKHGIEVRPSWLPFNPWTTFKDLVSLCDFVIAHDLVANVDPVQFTVRLLIPDGSLLLGDPALTPHLGPYDQARLGWTWAHPDPAIDELQTALAALVETRLDRPGDEIFAAIDALIRDRAQGGAPQPAPGSISWGANALRAHLSEPWFCCSEPTEAQLSPLRSPA